MTTPKERRGFQRLRSYKGGRVIFGNRLCIFDCVVRDRSERGARLKLVAPEFVPNSFFLNIPNEGFEAAAVVKHRAPGEIGVELVPEH